MFKTSLSIVVPFHSQKTPLRCRSYPSAGWGIESLNSLVRQQSVSHSTSSVEVKKAPIVVCVSLPAFFILYREYFFIFSEKTDAIVGIDLLIWLSNVLVIAFIKNTHTKKRVTLSTLYQSKMWLVNIYCDLMKKLLRILFNNTCERQHTQNKKKILNQKRI